MQERQTERLSTVQSTDNRAREREGEGEGEGERERERERERDGRCPYEDTIIFRPTYVTQRVVKLLRRQGSDCRVYD